jgi:hypothetical protein
MSKPNGQRAGLNSEPLRCAKDNQTFLRARFGLTEDVLEPYKKTIYKKAVGDPEGLADLMVFYCEQAARFAATLLMMMKDISMRWCACSSKS